jgi:hypothetical protein
VKIQSGISANRAFEREICHNPKRGDEDLGILSGGYVPTLIYFELKLVRDDEGKDKG